MKKILTALFLVCLILLGLSLPVFAGAPIDVEGFFTYTFECGEPWFAGSNTFMSCTDEETWTGDLIGVATTDYVIVFHGEDFSAGNFTSRGLFDGLVEGKDGTIEIKLTGQMNKGATLWKGTWRIVQGTGELEGAHGQGSWWGPVNTEGEFKYEGKVHFKP